MNILSLSAGDQLYTLAVPTGNHPFYECQQPTPAITAVKTLTQPSATNRITKQDTESRKSSWDFVIWKQ
jgi:hypothetical protein